MTKHINSEVDVAVAELKKDVRYLTEGQEEIKTDLKELNKKFDEFIKEINYKLDEKADKKDVQRVKEDLSVMKITMAKWTGIALTLVTVVQFLINNVWFK